MRSPARLAAATSLTLALGSLGCTNNPFSPSPTSEDPPGPVHAEFGLDTRPANPGCRAPERPQGEVNVELVDAFPNLTTLRRVVLLTQAPGDNTQWYAVEKVGRVQRFTNDPSVSNTSVFANIIDRVESNPSEAGLLGMAFHPNFASNGYVFLSYTASGQNGNALTSVISRFRTNAERTQVDPSSEEVLLTVPQFASNHNGGMIAFGPDGYLYIGFGDGGGGGDPEENGQDLQSLLGKMLRIDVDNGAAYAIPADNPLTRDQGLPEIYAWGLRNPWRFSFDRETGALWVADVGQNLWEEVDIIQRGGNYGWNIKEGTHCYNRQSCPGAFVEPVVDYGHNEGQSVTGGYVYRGTRIPALAGVYIYGDFSSGRVWGVVEDGATGERTAEVLLDSGLNISTFAQDQVGEVYVVSYDRGGIHRLEPDGTPNEDAFPTTLSQTGCVDPADPTRPAAGLIPYSVMDPFWSDGSVKERFMALPDGETIKIDENGDMELPVGTVLMKSFRLEGKLVETRLLMRHPDGEWGGYSYEWNDAETDAALLPAGKTRVVGANAWIHPSRGECMRCHTGAAGRSLGLEVRQLNGEHLYSTNRISNQLKTWEHIGLFQVPLSPSVEQQPALPALDGEAPLAERARAYLHVNCAYCHRPGSTGQGNANYLHWTPDADLGVCDEPPLFGDLGITGARLLLPGDAARSLIRARMDRRDAHAMPPLATTRVDEQGVQLISDWITTLTECP
ncbi:MAG: PQQ-dependent sugar dehydrogenase [Myxococcota bacterium]